MKKIRLIVVVVAFIFTSSALAGVQSVQVRERGHLGQTLNWSATSKIPFNYSLSKIQSGYYKITVSASVTSPGWATASVGTSQVCPYIMGGNSCTFQVWASSTPTKLQIQTFSLPSANGQLSVQQLSTIKES